ncbi:MAG: hypothetical protein ACREYF_18425, partial [Gammaproteobacteria bacterium]
MKTKAHGTPVSYNSASGITEEQGRSDHKASMGWQLINLLCRQLPFSLLNGAALAMMVALVLRDQAPS